MKGSNPEERYMRRCLELAARGLGHTAPNPMVGSVIVSDNRIIGEGYHQIYGLQHAEANAILSVTNKNLLHKSRLYVNLEPCAHSGKTPPCADLIIRTGISDVVIGSMDPNPLVSGKGIQKLRSAGINVTTGILKDECEKLNCRFFIYHKQKRPYIILKWAKTKDGFIDMIRSDDLQAEPAWISNEISKMLVHKWRTEEQAILVGTNTVMLDNPRLNVREWPGSSPVRMVIDKNLRLPVKLNLFDNTERTWVFNALTNKSEDNTQFIKIDFGKDMLYNMMDYLYKREIQSVFVEGGKKLIDSLLTDNLWDEARVFTGDKVFGSGILSPVIDSVKPDIYNVMDDTLMIYNNRSKN